MVASRLPPARSFQEVVHAVLQFPQFGVVGMGSDLDGLAKEAHTGLGHAGSVGAADDALPTVPIVPQVFFGRWVGVD